jgi:hypothetical protein
MDLPTWHLKDRHVPLKRDASSAFCSFHGGNLLRFSWVKAALPCQTPEPAAVTLPPQFTGKLAKSRFDPI